MTIGRQVCRSRFPARRQPAKANLRPRCRSVRAFRTYERSFSSLQVMFPGAWGLVSRPRREARIPGSRSETPATRHPQPHMFNRRFRRRRDVAQCYQLAWPFVLYRSARPNASPMTLAILSLQRSLAKIFPSGPIKTEVETIRQTAGLHAYSPAAPLAHRSLPAAVMPESVGAPTPPAPLPGDRCPPCVRFPNVLE